MEKLGLKEKVFSRRGDGDSLRRGDMSSLVETANRNSCLGSRRSAPLRC